MPVARRSLLCALLLLVSSIAAPPAIAGPLDLDPSFDGDGIAAPGVGTIVAVDRDASGRTIVVGSSGVRRLTSSGATDPTFNGGAVAPLQLTPRTVDVGADGSVYIGGSTGGFAAAAQPAVQHLLASGAPDSAYGGSGVAGVGYDDGGTTTAASVVGLAIAGSTAHAIIRADSGAHPGQVTQFDAAGTPVVGYGTRGSTQLTGARDLRAVLIDSAGRAVVAGCAGNGASSMIVARLTTAGALDGSFGNGAPANGLAVISSQDGSGPTCATALAPRPSGVVVAASTAGGQYSEIVGLSGNGLLDAGFQRRVVTWPGATVTGPGLALAQRSAGGYTLADALTRGGVRAFGLLRLRADGTEDPTLAPANAAQARGIADTALSPITAAQLDGAGTVLAGGGSSLTRIGTANRPPTVQPISGPSYALATDPVTFSASASDPDAGDSAIEVRWSFGNGAVDFGTSVNHTYASPGTYTVTVTARDGNGATSAPVTKEITIAQPAAGTADGRIETARDAVAAGVPTDLSVADLSIQPASYGPLKVRWDFGDGHGEAWTEADRSDPSARPWIDGGAGDQISHRFASYSGPNAFSNDPSSGPQRRTYLVRARLLDRFDRVVKVIARPITVLPNRSPIRGLQFVGDIAPGENPATSSTAGAPSYARGMSVWNQNAEPDAPLDAIVSEAWDINGDGTPDVQRDAPCQSITSGTSTRTDAELAKTYALCQQKNAVRFNPFLVRSAGRPVLSKRYSDAELAGDQAALAGQIQFDAGATGLSGVDATKQPWSVSVTQTDRAGNAVTTTRKIPLSPWRAPVPKLSFPDSRPPSAPVGSAAPGGVQLNAPVVAGTTDVSIGLRETSVDPATAPAFFILRVGLPSPPPCKDRKQPKTCQFTTSRDLVQNSTILTKVVRGSAASTTIRFPQPSAEGQPWSIQVTAFDETGAMGVARYDGFTVVGADGLACSTVDGRPVGGVNIAADCVNSVDPGQQLLFTKRPVSVNGVTLQATGGKGILMATCSKEKTFIVATDEPAKGTSCDAFTTQGRRSGAKDTDPDERVSLDVLIDGTPVSRIPVDELPKFLELIDKTGTLPLKTREDGRYKGLEISDADSFKLTFGGGGASTVELTTKMPTNFGVKGADRPTGGATINGLVAPRGIVVSEFDGVAQKQAIGKPRRARRAEAAPGCGGPTSIAMPSDLTVGGFSLSDIGTLCFDPATNTFEANLKLAIQDRVVTGRLVLRDGSLVEIAGRADAEIPIGGGAVNLKTFAFRLANEPGGMKLTASVTFADKTGVVSGTGTITITPERPELRIDADVNVAMIPAHADFTINPSGARFNATAGKDFGPVSLTATLAGAVSGAGFFIEGQGNACLGACITVKAMLSNEAIAGCGTLKLLFVELSAGFGYRFGGSPDVWVGSCDLSAYRPKAFAARAGGAPAALPPGVAQATSSPDGWRIPTAPSIRAISVVVDRAPADRDIAPAVDVRFVPDQAKEIKGQAPLVTEVVRTKSELGAAFRVESSGVVVDQDPQLHQTRLLIPIPKDQVQGTYLVRSTTGQAIPVPVYAYGGPPITKDVFTTIKVGPKDSLVDPPKGTMIFGTSPLGQPSVDPNETIKGTTGLKPAGKRASAARLGPKGPIPDKTPVLTTGQFEKKDADGIPSTTKVLAEQAISAKFATQWELAHLRPLFVSGKLPPGEQVHFILTIDGEEAENMIGAVVADKSGEFNATLALPGFGERANKLRCIRAVVTSLQGVPRGSVSKLACFKVEPILTPKDPGPIELATDPKTISLDARFGEPRVLGEQPMGAFSYEKGRIRGTVVVTPNIIAATAGQAGGAARYGARADRLAAAASRGFQQRPVRDRTWRIRVRLPKGAGKVRVRSLSVPQGARRVRASETVTLTGKRRAARVRR